MKVPLWLWVTFNYDGKTCKSHDHELSTHTIGTMTNWGNWDSIFNIRQKSCAYLLSLWYSLLISYLTIEVVCSVYGCLQDPKSDTLHFACLCFQKAFGFLGKVNYYLCPHHTNFIITTHPLFVWKIKVIYTFYWDWDPPPSFAKGQVRIFNPNTVNRIITLQESKSKWVSRNPFLSSPW